MAKNTPEVLHKVTQREFNPLETLQILKANQIWLWSWAARNFSQWNNKALWFTVSGHLHKGIVLITLAWNDTYTVTLLTTKWTVKKEITDVYFDELAQTIDINVERIPQYNS